MIFITEKDIFGDGASVHVIQMTDTWTGEIFEDGRHIIYVNGEYHGDDAVGMLMHDFNCTDAQDMNYSLMAWQNEHDI